MFRHLLLGFSLTLVDCATTNAQQPANPPEPAAHHATVWHG